MRRFKEGEWEAVAGVAAAVIAPILHLLHVDDIDVLITVRRPPGGRLRTVLTLC
jgi:hypothetical protein